MQGVGKYVALKLIVGYQRFLSPYKGFRCAYAHHTGCASCSRLGYRAIRRNGVALGVRLLLARFDRCRDAHLAAIARQLDHTRPRSAAAPFVAMRSQRGFCDALACVPCDAGCLAAPCDGSAAGSACDAASCLGGLPCPCDVASCWPWESERPRAAKRSASGAEPHEAARTTG